MLQWLHDEAPTDHFTLGWLMGSLRRRSFGIIMLLLALVAMAPGVSIIAGLLLMIPAFQMVAGQPAPVFPRRIAARPLPTRHLAALVQRAVPVLRYLEKAIHPRWPTPLEATKRLVGTVIVILNTTMVFTRRAVDMDFLVDEGTIDAEDRDLFWFAETARDIWNGILHWHQASGEPLRAAT